MRNKILALLFGLMEVIVYGQRINDTIKIDSKKIELIQVYSTDNPRSKPKCYIKRIEKDSKKALNGLYKVILDSSYYITNYKNGFEDNSLFNIKKTFVDEELKILDVKGHQAIGSNYLSIPNYKCLSNIVFKAFKKEYMSDEIITEVNVYQKIINDTINWDIIYPGGKIGRFKIKALEICK